MTYAMLHSRLAQLGDIPLREFVRQVRSLALGLAIFFALIGLFGLALGWLGGRVGQTLTVALPRPWHQLLWVAFAILVLLWMVRRGSKSMLGFLYQGCKPLFKDKTAFAFAVGALAIFGVVGCLADLFLPRWAFGCVVVFILFCGWIMVMLLDRVPELARASDQRAHLRVELRRALGESIEESSYLDEEFLLSLRPHGLSATIKDCGPGRETRHWLASVTDEKDQLWGSYESGRQSRFEVLARAWLLALRATAGEQETKGYDE
ncbi:MAG: hypothetical protein ACLQVM_17565 [Terriglobia bacterium]